jgi:hypothetical protein
MLQPDSQPTSFLTLEPGTPVVDRFGCPVGAVRRVLLLETGGFDGIIVSTRAGARFVDAPEVRRISGGAVTLGIAVADVESPAAGGPGAYGVPEARHDRTDVTEADRDEAIDCLKRAYVRDELTTQELAERVAVAHVAEKLEQLDTALADISVG